MFFNGYNLSFNNVGFFDTSIFTTGGQEQLIIIIQITSNHALHSSSSVDQNNSIELYISTFGLK